MNTIHRGVRGGVVMLVLLVWMSMLTACGAARSTRMVSSRFQALHSCEPETVRSSSSGYVVTGCGIQAHYAAVSYDPFPGSPGSRTGGSITFVALPERFPDKAVVRLFVLHADAASEERECAGDLWIDGARVTAHQATIESVPGGALHSLLVDLSALDRMGPAQRVAARVCGVDVVIADPAGPLASQLAIRAREESSASRL